MASPMDSAEWLRPSVIAALIAAALLGLVLGWLLARLRHSGHHPEQCERRAREQGERIEALETESAARLEAVHAARTRLAVAEDKSARIPSLEAELGRRSTRLETLQAECAELKTRLESERSHTEEKLALLRDAEVRLFAQFDSLAQRILDEKTRKFTEQNRSQLDGLLAPFREQLGDFRRKVDEMHVHDAKDRASLKQEIEHLRRDTQRINQEAVNLTRALKGDKKLQGNWGELILEKVLEQSGLRKDIEYETQGGFRDGGQQLFRPDVVVRLPEGRDIVIDSKVSLAAYERCCALDDGPERDAALREHVQAVRTHIKTLARKNYAGLEGLRSLDFILMFMPIEAAFLLAFQHDDQLFADAFGSHIVVVTPTTLLATLRTVENLWRYERRNENAKVIADKAGAVYDKLRGFAEDMEKLGLQLGGAQKAYEDAMNKLTRGRGNLIRQAESFVALGSKVNKRLPRSILERAEMEPEDEAFLDSAARQGPGKPSPGGTNPAGAD